MSYRHYQRELKTKDLVEGAFQQNHHLVNHLITDKNKINVIMTTGQKCALHEGSKYWPVN